MDNCPCKNCLVLSMCRSNLKDLVVLRSFGCSKLENYIASDKPDVNKRALKFRKIMGFRGALWI